MAASANASVGLTKRLRRILRQLLCRHEFRDSRSMPGVRICTKCGLHKGRLSVLY